MTSMSLNFIYTFIYFIFTVAENPSYQFTKFTTKKTNPEIYG
jgi:hypothetical protein